MRKSVLALAAASAVFALTAAGATGTLVLNGGLGSTLAAPNSGSVDITQTQCTDPWTITYAQVNPGDPIPAVTATDTAVTPATACGSSTTATWAFANGHPVNGTWDNTAHAWTFDYSAIRNVGPTAAVGVGYPLISNAAAIAGNLTVGGPVATDPCPVGDPVSTVPVPAPAPGVNWSFCVLQGMDLSNANLTGADLTDAWMQWTNLTGANLTGANLSGAHLLYAPSTDATLTDVIYSNTTCPNAMNSSAYNPQTCANDLNW